MEIKDIPVTDLYWLAGILEGEGCFSIDKALLPRRKTLRLRIRCEMTDEDVVVRVRKIVGVGTIRSIPPRNVNCKSTWQWELATQPCVIKLCNLVLPIMGQRRQEKIQQMLASIKEV